MSDAHDSELTPQERRLGEEIRGLGGVRPAEDFRARLRADFVSGALASSSAADRPGAASDAAPARAEVVRLRRRRPVWAVVPAALAAVLAFVLLSGGGPAWELRAVSGAGSVVVDGRAYDVADAAALARAIGPGAHVEVGASAVVDVICGDVAVLGLGSGTDAVLPDDPDRSGRPLTVDVRSGDVAVTTGPGFPGRRLVLGTSEGLTEITGTTVAVFKCEELTCVCVREGTAQVGRDAAHLEPVPGGRRKVMFADGRAPMLDAIEPGHALALDEFVARTRGAFD